MRRHQASSELLCLALTCAAFTRVCAAVGILYPTEGSVLEYIPDIPLWVRLERGPSHDDECWEFRLDGESVASSCRVDTILPVRPTPGGYLLEIVAVEDQKGDHVLASSFFHVVGFGFGDAHRIPPSMASPDG